MSLTDVAFVTLDKSYATIAGIAARLRSALTRRPDVGWQSLDTKIGGAEIASKSDLSVGKGTFNSSRRALINRNLKAHRALGDKSEGFFVDLSTEEQWQSLLRVFRKWEQASK